MTVELLYNMASGSDKGLRNTAGYLASTDKALGLSLGVTPDTHTKDLENVYNKVKYCGKGHGVIEVSSS